MYETDFVIADVGENVVTWLCINSSVDKKLELINSFSLAGSRVKTATCIDNYIVIRRSFHK